MMVNRTTLSFIPFSSLSCSIGVPMTGMASSGVFGSGTLFHEQKLIKYLPFVLWKIGENICVQNNLPTIAWINSLKRDVSQNVLVSSNVHEHTAWLFCLQSVWK